MNTRQINGVPVLMPETDQDLRDALASGQPFEAPPHLARDFGLPEDPHMVDGQDIGILDPEEDEA